MVNFGIVYGISSFGLSENLGIPRDEAQELIDTYLARLPRVQELIKRTIAQAAADGYVTTLLGRRRPIPELRASNRQTRSLGERLAVNTVMQGTAADVIKVAMVRIHERLRTEGPRRAARPPGARRAPARGARRSRRAPSATSCARRWSAPIRSTRRSRSRRVSATPGPTRRIDARAANSVSNRRRSGQSYNDRQRNSTEGERLHETDHRGPRGARADARARDVTGIRSRRPKTTSVQLLAINDLHGHLQPNTPGRSRSAAATRCSRTACRPAGRRRPCPQAASRTSRRRSRRCATENTEHAHRRRRRPDRREPARLGAVPRRADDRGDELDRDGRERRRQPRVRRGRRRAAPHAERRLPPRRRLSGR